MAREHAGVTADEIDWIVAHGTSTPLNDVTETRAIKASFGPAATKVADLVAEVDDRAPRGGRRDRLRAGGDRRASATRCISPTINHENPDLPECDLDYVPLVARKARVDTVMVNGFGFGGQNAVAIFRRYAG